MGASETLSTRLLCSQQSFNKYIFLDQKRFFGRMNIYLRKIYSFFYKNIFFKWDVYFLHYSIVFQVFNIKLFFHIKTVFFSIRVFFTDTDDSQGSRRREGTIFYSTLVLPPTHEHWDIYFQLSIWDDYNVFLIATLVFTRLPLDEIYDFIELPFLLIDWWCNIC